MRRPAVLALFLLLPVIADAGTPLPCSKVDRSPERASAASLATTEDVARCAAEGDAVALNELGRRHGTGKGAELSAETSFQMYRKAAEAGYTQAKANLGFMYFQGEGVTQDYGLAYRWSKEAAEEGSAQAQHALGYVHATGTGGRKDGKLAEKWLLAAANQGYVPAQQALIRLYSDGELVPANARKAMLWTHRARDAVLHGQVWRKSSK